MSAHRRARDAIAPCITLACLLQAWCPPALALDPTLDVSQYAHTAWKIRDGFPKSQINSIAQTPDGYLWLGTEFGLFRFDGVKATPWQPEPSHSLPSSSISILVAARDGTLWIGTVKGLASWTGDKLTRYPELDGKHVAALLEDSEGSIWASTNELGTAQLCVIRNGNPTCYGEEVGRGFGIFSLYEDGKRNLWVGVHDGVWQWKPGVPKFHALPGVPDGIQALSADDDGALLVGQRDGVHRLVDGKVEAFPVDGPIQPFRAKKILRDRDGGLWIGTSDRGLIHIHQGRPDVFASADGLSGEAVSSLFEDREGNIWSSTGAGLDRFRTFAVTSFSTKQGLSNGRVGSVLAAKDGSVWFGTSVGLRRWNNGRLEVPGTGGGSRDGTLNGLVPHSLLQDRRGRIWVTTSDGAGYLEGERFISVAGVPGGNVQGITEDSAGNLWMANLEFGLFRVSPRNEIQQFPWPTLGHDDFASVLAADPLRGGVWLGFARGGVLYFADNRAREAYAADQGLAEGRVTDLRVDPDGTLWAATEGGLSRLKDGRGSTLSSKNGLPCDGVHWMVQEADDSWLMTPCGLVRVARLELDAWAAAANHDPGTNRTIRVAVHDSSDGVRLSAGGGGYTPQVTKTVDGKLWFHNRENVSVFDPHRIPFNALPPPVQIEQIVADRKSYAVSSAGAPVRLPPRVRDLQLDYTALSFVAPEKMLFRYKLEDYDREWHDAGPRRQAFYNDLPPGHYRFRVTASNNSGVWNEAGASLDFSVAPAYYQATWFRASCAALFLALLGVVYELRRRHLERQFSVRIEERVGERTRIARELHDTLLQSFQGILLMFQAAAGSLPDRPAEAQQRLAGVINRAEQAITEGRDAVRALRVSTLVTNDLARDICAFGEKLAAEQPGGSARDFRVSVAGTSRDLVPLVRDEVFRIAREALRNAFQHAQAERIEVGVRYGRRRFRLSVRDNGHGIASAVLAEGGRKGHFGLTGMRERAQLAGGKLAIRSGLDSGTEIELTIPASRAYARSSRLRRWLSRRS